MILDRWVPQDMDAYLHETETCKNGLPAWLIAIAPAELPDDEDRRPGLGLIVALLVSIPVWALMAALHAGLI